MLWCGFFRSESSKQTALDRTISLKNFHGTTADAVSAMLAQARLSGGIVTLSDRCAQPDQLPLNLNEISIRNGLDQIANIDHSRAWIFSSGQILVGNQLLKKTILSKTVGEVVFKGGEPLSLSTQRLIQSKEVQQQVTRAGLQELSPSLGFAGVEGQSGQTTSHSVDQPVKRVSHKQLYEALNALAAARGRVSVWHYEQFSCGGKQSFRISWTVE